MARPKKRKRQPNDPLNNQNPPKRAKQCDLSPRWSRSQNQNSRADETDQTSRPSIKKLKSSDTFHGPSNFPPEFYDDLSKVWLTRRALQELDRRNEGLPTKSTIGLAKHRGAKLAAHARLGVSELALFATAGGPDLSDLQGYPEPTNSARTMATASSSVTSKRVSAGSRRTQSTQATTVSAKSKRSSAYDNNFVQCCIDHHIYPPVYKFPDGSRLSRPANFTEIRQALKVPRASLSPSVVPETAFEDFQDKNATRSEGTVMRNVVPLVAGDLDIPNEGHLPFTNLASLTGHSTVNPVPDFFDGAHPEAICKKVREDLDNIIMPTKKGGVPIAPNFFLEAKGVRGTADVATAQAVLDGAHGALIMHTLQNYLVDTQLYDGNAYTFSSTLLDGTLKLYAHHLSAPTESRKTPSYHATLVKAYALSDDEVYSEGRGAFRNLRIRAKEDRDRFIEIANARARLAERTTNPERDDHASPVTGPEDEGSSPLDFFDCEMFAGPEDNNETTPETQETQETHLGLAILHYEDDKDGEEDPDTSLLTSFTSSFTSEFSREDRLPSQRPKLPRSPPSPLSTRPKKRGPIC